MECEAEIAKIRSELDILRARYALYARWGRVLRIFFMIWLPLFAGVVLGLVIKLFLYDTIFGAFAVGMMCIVAAILWLLRDRNQPLFLPGRWINLASLPMRPTSLYPGVPSFYFSLRSDAEIIEQQIAEREQRMVELLGADHRAEEL